MALTDGLVAYYTLGGDAIDSSGNNYHGTISGATSSSTSVLGNSLYFNGADTTFLTVDNLNFDWSGHSLNFWFKTSDFGDNKLVYMVHDSTNWIRIDTRNTDDIRVSIETAGTYDDETCGYIDTGWHMLTLIDNGTGTEFYIDNSLIGTISVTLPSFSGTNSYMNIGGIDGESGFGWTGYLDELSLYNRALTSTEISELYNSGSGKRPDTLKLGNKAYYSFDDGTATDLSGNGNNGTIYGATSVSGKLSNAMSFDGSDDYIKSPSYNNIKTSDVTIAGWYYINNLGTNGIILFSASCSNGEFYLYASNNGKIRVRIGSYSDESGNSLSTLNKWYYVVLIYRRNTGNTIVYVDNVKKYEDTLGTNDFTCSYLNIGNYNDNDLTSFPFNGLIDEPTIYSRPLAKDEIAMLYNNGDGYNPYSTTPTGWANKILGLTSISKINGIDNTNISKVNGI